MLLYVHNLLLTMCVVINNVYPPITGPKSPVGSVVGSVDSSAGCRFILTSTTLASVGFVWLHTYIHTWYIHEVMEYRII